MKKIWTPSIILLLLAGCNNAAPNPEEATAPFDEIATGLEAPWAINKTGDEFYISERAGTVAYIDEEGALTRQKVSFSDSLSSAAEAGFLGFVLKQDFDESQEAYGYYVYERDGNDYNKIVSMQLDNGQWRENEVLLEGIPTGDVHHGGRLELDENGTLFATVGDASTPELAQDLASVNGKLLKLNNSDEFEIYSHGHRNPQGITWDGDTIYASEHGQSANDEINIIEEGLNYGWPTIEGDESEEGMEAPFFTTGSDETWAPSGMDIHNGSLYVAALRGTAIKVLDPESAEVTDSIEGFGRVRDVYSDGDSLYFISNNTDGRGIPADGDDKLYKLNE
ncbi:PQQ-dependent sugar dehydrogenase [Microbacterium sp. APC 3898]|uniref:PQQ-dependent sugar dehydrogenase n=1 Tax=Planococcus notacanthi TaxID=3035188 RepID=A0ABT7ZGU9_9BACL|nr:MULTISPECIES: PQQ-dependent sugar dehydrogenase [Terrabacteria group]MDN3426376.1 PQQ-dependent sugar dehydrogenase [Planococcus sp. APC 4016]MDN3498072.1 PQQ-dependent sugar dehydrogenase [Microbacterium sp. APC 3898]